MGKRARKKDEKVKQQEPQSDGVVWLPAGDRRFTMRGLWWYEENGGTFCRLPKRAQGVVREPVWELAQCPASARLCFRSDTTAMRVRCALRSAVPFAHMPLTGHSGLALYCGEPYRQVPRAVAFPQMNEKEFQGVLFEGVSPRIREYTLYLPPYNAPVAVEIGLTRDARIEEPSPLALDRPLVFYGTSITQGGCVHTAGADYASILGRMLNLDVVNLGFSGNGKGEPEVARFISEIDASLYALDYVANVSPEDLRETLPVFVKILREAHPDTPIVLMSRVVYTACTFSLDARARHEAQRDVIIHFYSQARRDGDANIHFVDGNSLINYAAQLAYSDQGVHPTNVGFQMMAEALAPQIAQILLPDE